MLLSSSIIEESSPLFTSSLPPLHCSTIPALLDSDILISFQEQQRMSLLSVGWTWTTTLQRLGENVFTATFIIAFLQASIALIQYRTNPSGELIIPPGPTIGVEDPTTQLFDEDSSFQCSSSTLRQFSSVLEELRQQQQDQRNAVDQSRYARILNRMNRFLVLLFPWVARQANYLLMKQSHLLHIGFIMTLAKFFDIPNAFWGRKQRSQEQQVVKSSCKDIQRIVVIGDSLAVGLGSVSIFDKFKNNTAPMYRIENLSPGNNNANQSPVFPRAFACSIAKRLERPIHWRSAGVDGGAVVDIQHFCLDVIREEVAKDRAPDCVVIICGINDLKQFVSNPFRSTSPRDFRNRLTSLIAEIRQLCPAKVILPALPTQMINKNSPLNIFPLNIFIDAMVGFWDSQKKITAETFPSGDVTYVGLSADDIQEWYNRDTFGDDDGSLIAADGVHPNRRCYAHWAETIANRLLDSEKGS